MASSLRGGKNLYGPKTLIGPWVESGKRAHVIPTNSISGFVSSAVDQQLDSQKDAPPRFGRGLPPAEDDNMDWGNVIAPNTNVPAERYQSVTQLVHRPPNEPKTPNEFNATKHKLGGMSKEELQVYKEEWTRESELGRGQRWKTTTNSSQMTTSKLTRALPGAPLSYDALIEKLTAKDSASSDALKAQVPGASGMMDFEQFKAAVSGCGVDMLDQQLTQIFDFFDPTDTGIISVEGLF